jgi:hypothetical protein
MYRYCDLLSNTIVYSIEFSENIASVRTCVCVCVGIRVCAVVCVISLVNDPQNIDVVRITGLLCVS